MHDRDGAALVLDRITGRFPFLERFFADAAGMRFACAGERELLAYRAQDAWLGLFGESLEGAFGIDSATLLVATTCTY